MERTLLKIYGSLGNGGFVIKVTEFKAQMKIEQLGEIVTYTRNTFSGSEYDSLNFTSYCAPEQEKEIVREITSKLISSFNAIWKNACETREHAANGPEIVKVRNPDPLPKTGNIKL